MTSGWWPVLGTALAETLEGAWGRFRQIWHPLRPFLPQEPGLCRGLAAGTAQVDPVHSHTADPAVSQASTLGGLEVHCEAPVISTVDLCAVGTALTTSDAQTFPVPPNPVKQVQSQASPHAQVGRLRQGGSQPGRSVAEL